MTTRAATTALVEPAAVHDVLGRHLLFDGLDLVLDTAASHGSWLVDARDGGEYLDLFTFVASSPLGMNHPGLVADPGFMRTLAEVAVNKPANSDVYTTHLAAFVQTFERVLGDPGLPHLFLIEGGAAAVENALKTAFDWKQRHNRARGRPERLGTRVLHLTRAFHGRGGYTLSLTNTDPVKVAGYPKFDWPRVDVPAARFPLADHLGQVRAAERRALDQARDAFRAHRHDALFVLDEVQTGGGLTGTPWAYQQLGVQPDVVAFGKKLQVCGVMAGGRVDEVADNVSTVPSRINSTWGGNLTDIVRARRILEVIEADGLITRASRLGAVLLTALEELRRRHPDLVGNVRGRGLICAVDLPSPRLRDELVRRLRTRERVLMLPSGRVGLRFRPTLAVTEEELLAGCAAVGRVLDSLGNPEGPP